MMMGDDAVDHGKLGEVPNTDDFVGRRTTWSLLEELKILLNQLKPSFFQAETNQWLPLENG